MDSIEKLKNEIAAAEAIVIGAGSGLSTAAGMTYSGERFTRYFDDFAQKYPMTDMYSGGFTRFDSPEEQWAWWSRNIYINRYMKPLYPVYERLYELFSEKNYFIITTNVDHCFQRAGFDKRRLFYTQGDYGLWQCAKPCHQECYDNEKQVRLMLESQGLELSGDTLLPAEKLKARMTIPPELIPRCPVCGGEMSMNLRCDDTFVQTEGWYTAEKSYRDFIERYRSGHILLLELGVGANTPGWIKYPFWRLAYENRNAVYACLNHGEAYAPKEIAENSICINTDIKEILELL